MTRRTIPIIRLDDVLLVSIQIELSDRLVLDLREDIANEIHCSSVAGLIVDVSGTDILDSFIARSIRDISRVSSLMGVETIVVGMSAGIAIALVEMGMTMSGIGMALNLDQGLEILSRHRGLEGTGAANRKLPATRS